MHQLPLGIQQVFSLPQFEDEHQNYQAQMIYLISIISLVILLCHHTLALLIGTPQFAARFIPPIPYMIMVMLNLWSLKQGNLNRTKFLLVWGWGCLIWVIWNGGGLFAPSYSLLLVVIIISSILFGISGTVGSLLAVICISFIFLGLHMYTDLLPPPFENRIIDVFWGGVLRFGATAALLATVMHRLNQLLAQVQAAEKVLRERNQQLIQSEARYRQIVETAREGIWMLNTKGKTTFVNPALAKLLGYTSEEMLGLPLMMFMDQKLQSAMLSGVIRHQRIINERADIQLICKDGTSIWVLLSATPLHDETGEITGVLAMVSDITARIESENRIRALETSFRLLFSDNPQPMWVFDAQTLQFLEVNNAAIEKYGYTRDEFLAMRLPEIHPMGETPALATALNGVNLTTSHSSLGKHQLKNKSIIQAEVYSRELLFLGKPAYVSVIVDMTEKIQMEAIRLENQQITADLEREKQLRAFKNRFIAMISHDFRNPLTAMQLRISMLQNSFERMTPDRREEKLMGLLDQIQIMDDLLDDVLWVGETENLQPTLDLEVGHLDELCRKIITEFQENTPSHHLRLELEGQRFFYRFDVRLMRRLLTNLLSNAIKYSPAASEVILRLVAHTRGYRLEVHDQGIGIPLTDQPYLFESFYRASNVKDIKGTGLGLVIVKQIVELHGGTVTVQSEPQQGTVFILQFPHHPDLY